MATQDQKFLDYQGLSTVAPYIKERLKTVITMPVSAINNTTVLFIGTTSGSYIQGHIYQYSTATSTWIDITAASSNTYTAGNGLILNNNTFSVVAALNGGVTVNNSGVSLDFESTNIDFATEWDN